MISSPNTPTLARRDIVQSFLGPTTLAHPWPLLIDSAVSLPQGGGGGGRGSGEGGVRAVDGVGHSHEAVKRLFLFRV